MPTGQPIPSEGNWVDGVSHPSNSDVGPKSPFQPGRLQVDCSSEGADSDSMEVFNAENKRRNILVYYIFLQFIVIYIKTKDLFKIAKLEKRTYFSHV